MSLINRNVEQKNNKILKVLDITKVDGEISELDVVEFRNEGKVYSEGTPLEANCLNNVIQEIIDNALQQRNNADYNNLSFTEEITAEVPLPVKGENGSKLSWSVTKGTAITINGGTLGHANDVTYNNKKNEIYVISASGSAKLNIFDNSDVNKAFDTINNTLKNII